MSPEALEAGYWDAYREFYRWSSILESSSAKPTRRSQLRHVAYAAGWKKFEGAWNLAIRAGQVARLLPVLESILNGFGSVRPTQLPAPPTSERPDDSVPVTIGSRS
jgi:hypothetical protein